MAAARELVLAAEHVLAETESAAAAAHRSVADHDREAATETANESTAQERETEARSAYQQRAHQMSDAKSPNGN